MRQTLSAIGLALALITCAGSQVSAQAVVTLAVTGRGDIAASIIDASFPTPRSGYLDIEVTDNRGLAEGWDIVLSIEPSSARIAMLGPYLVHVLAGQPIGETGPAVGGTGADQPGHALHRPGVAPATRFDTGASVLRAERGAGSGSYMLNLSAAASALPADPVVTVTVSLAP